MNSDIGAPSNAPFGGSRPVGDHRAALSTPPTVPACPVTQQRSRPRPRTVGEGLTTRMYRRYRPPRADVETVAAQPFRMMDERQLIGAATSTALSARPSRACKLNNQNSIKASAQQQKPRPPPTSTAWKIRATTAPRCDCQCAAEAARAGAVLEGREKALPSPGQHSMCIGIGQRLFRSGRAHEVYTIPHSNSEYSHGLAAGRWKEQHEGLAGLARAPDRMNMTLPPGARPLPVAGEVPAVSAASRMEPSDRGPRIARLAAALKAVASSSNGQMQPEQCRGGYRKSRGRLQQPRRPSLAEPRRSI